MSTSATGAYQTQPYTITPYLWSSGYWLVLFSIAFTYDAENATQDQQTRIINYFNNLMIPCANCQTNYATYLAANPFTTTTIQTRDTLIDWLLSLRNSIRSANNQQLFSKQSVVDYYTELNFTTTVMQSSPYTKCSDC